MLSCVSVVVSLLCFVFSVASCVFFLFLGVFFLVLFSFVCVFLVVDIFLHISDNAAILIPYRPRLAGQVPRYSKRLLELVQWHSYKCILFITLHSGLCVWHDCDIQRGMP